MYTSYSSSIPTKPVKWTSIKSEDGNQHHWSMDPKNGNLSPEEDAWNKYQGNTVDSQQTTTFSGISTMNSNQSGNQTFNFSGQSSGQFGNSGISSGFSGSNLNQFGSSQSQSFSNSNGNAGSLSGSMSFGGSNNFGGNSTAYDSSSGSGQSFGFGSGQSSIGTSFGGSGNNDSTKSFSGMGTNLFGTGQSNSQSNSFSNSQYNSGTGPGSQVFQFGAPTDGLSSNQSFNGNNNTGNSTFSMPSNYSQTSFNPNSQNTIGKNDGGSFSSQPFGTGSTGGSFGFSGNTQGTTPNIFSFGATGQNVNSGSFSQGFGNTNSSNVNSQNTQPSFMDSYSQKPQQNTNQSIGGPNSFASSFGQTNTQTQSSSGQSFGSNSGSQSFGQGFAPTTFGAPSEKTFEFGNQVGDCGFGSGSQKNGSQVQGGNFNGNTVFSFGSEDQVNQSSQQGSFSTSTLSNVGNVDTKKDVFVFDDQNAPNSQPQSSLNGFDAPKLENSLSNGTTTVNGFNPSSFGNLSNNPGENIFSNQNSSSPQSTQLAPQLSTQLAVTSFTNTSSGTNLSTSTPQFGIPSQTTPNSSVQQPNGTNITSTPSNTNGTGVPKLVTHYGDPTLDAIHQIAHEEMIKRNEPREFPQGSLSFLKRGTRVPVSPWSKTERRSETQKNDVISSEQMDILTRGSLNKQREVFLEKKRIEKDRIERETRTETKPLVVNQQVNQVVKPVPIFKPKPCKFLPILARSDYWCKPSLKEIEKLDSCVIHDFTIGHAQFGEITFPGFVDVSSINLDDVVLFEKGSITLFPKGDSAKPVYGTGLYRPALVKLFGMYPKKSSSLSKYVDRMKSRLENTDGKHVNYSAETGVWKFEIQLFETKPK